VAGGEMRLLARCKQCDAKCVVVLGDNGDNDRMPICEKCGGELEVVKELNRYYTGESGYPYDWINTATTAGLIVIYTGRVYSY
jgi:hypothetical protein